MPLPDEPFTIEGGCNCGAIRYRVQVPCTDERPIYPGNGADAKPPVRMPLSCTDHCNDCRAATGALLPCWLLTPMSMISVSLVNTSSLTKDGRLDATVSRFAWLPALDVFRADEPIAESSLTFFASSEGRRRSFCSRCGTMFGYQVFPKLDFIEYDMLDLVLGTIDRQYLERIDLMPERQLWWKTGLKKVQDLSENGMETPIHADWSVTTNGKSQ